MSESLEQLQAQLTEALMSGNACGQFLGTDRSGPTRMEQDQASRAEEIVAAELVSGNQPDEARCESVHSDSTLQCEERADHPLSWRLHIARDPSLTPERIYVWGERDDNSNPSAFHERDFLDWARRTLPASPAMHLRKIAEEHAELQANPCPDGAADVALALLVYCDSAGIDLEASMAAKFAVLRSRGWSKQADGTWHHTVTRASRV